MSTSSHGTPPVPRGAKIALLVLLGIWAAVMGGLLIASARKKPLKLPTKWLQPFNCPGLIDRVRECTFALTPYLRQYLAEREGPGFTTSLKASFIDTAVAQVLADPRTLLRCRRDLARAQRNRPALVKKVRACYRRPSCFAFAECVWKLKDELLALW